MLKKLLVWVAVLLVAALLAVPAFAQARADLTLMWGSDEWLINQFGDENGDLTEFCQAAAEDKAGWSAQFPNLVGLCGW